LANFLGEVLFWRALYIHLHYKFTVAGIHWSTWMKQHSDWQWDWHKMSTETNVLSCWWVQ